jgi:hypothetical protein
VASYAQRAAKLNPKERKAQQKTDKKALKKSAVPQSTASAGDSATSFEDEMETVEADVTKLVLQVGCCAAAIGLQLNPSVALLRFFLCVDSSAMRHVCLSMLLQASLWLACGTSQPQQCLRMTAACTARRSCQLFKLVDCTVFLDNMFDART